MSVRFTMILELEPGVSWIDFVETAFWIEQGNLLPSLYFGRWKPCFKMNVHRWGMGPLIFLHDELLFLSH